GASWTRRRPAAEARPSCRPTAPSPAWSACSASRIPPRGARRRPRPASAASSRGEAPQHAEEGVAYAGPAIARDRRLHRELAVELETAAARLDRLDERLRLDRRRGREGDHGLALAGLDALDAEGAGGGADAHDVQALLGPQQVAGPPDLEVAQGELEARPQLGQLLQGPEPPLGLVVHPAVGRDQQVAEGLQPLAADPPPKLVELGETEAIGPVDDHRVRRRDVEARLDDRGGDQDVGLAVDELDHRGL